MEIVDSACGLDVHKETVVGCVMVSSCPYNISMSYVLRIVTIFCKTQRV